MTIQAWIFLVSSNKHLDYRTVACPDFICKRKAHQLLYTIKYNTNLNEQGDLYCREIDNHDFQFTLIYRCKKLTKEELLPQINETPTDGGRPILLIEGIIIERIRANEVTNNKIIFSKKQFNEIHQNILDYYKNFWDNVNGDGLPYETFSFELNQDNSDQELMTIVLDSSHKKHKEDNLKEEGDIIKNNTNVTLLTKKDSDKQLIIFTNTSELKHKILQDKIHSFAFDPKRNCCAFGYEDESIGFYSYRVNNSDFNLEEIRHFDLQEKNPIEKFFIYAESWLSKSKPSKISLAFTYIGEIIASSLKFNSQEKEFEVKLWKLSRESEEIIRNIKFKANKEDSILIACSPNDETIAINNPRDIILYNSEESVLAGYKDSIKSIDISKSSQSYPPLITIGNKVGIIKLWNLKTKKLISSILKAHSSSINSIVFSHDGSIFASGSDDKDIKFWDSKTGNLIHTINTDSPVQSLAFDPKGTLLASGHDDKTIKLWNMENKHLTNTLTKHQSAVTSLGFSLDSRILISLSKDLEAIVWFVAN
jgi:hypothetical protein